MNQMWIDGEYMVGDQGFLIRRTNTRTGTAFYRLSGTPPRTNQSLEYRPIGWCGTDCDLSTHGQGVWKVIKAAANGRAKIAAVTGKAELTAFLEETGFPELLDELLEPMTA